MLPFNKPHLIKLNGVLIFAAISFTTCRSIETSQISKELGSDTGPNERSRNSRSDLPEFKMTKELPDVTRRLTNMLNTCWLQAGIKELEFAQYKTTGKGVALSAEHMMMSALHERFFRIIQGAKINSAELESGGEMNEVRQLARRYGVIPEKTWSQSAKQWGEMAKKLNTIGADYRKEFIAHNRSGKDTKPLIAAAEKEFEAILDEFDVHQPAWFLDDGKKTTPLEFAKKFAKEDPEDYILLLAKQHHPTKPTKKSLLTVQNGFLTSWENIESSIIHEIEQKRSVLLSVLWSDKGIKISNGILRVIEKPLTGHLDGHVVNIVGYHLNDQGRIDRLKIENSWGRYEGSSGFYSVSWDDLKAMYIGITIPNGFNFIQTRQMRGEKVLD